MVVCLCVAIEGDDYKLCELLCMWVGWPNQRWTHTHTHAHTHTHTHTHARTHVNTHTLLQVLAALLRCWVVMQWL